MKFSINKTELQNALSIVMSGISSRPQIPALSGIYIDARADGLTLRSTDRVSSIQYEVAALVEEEGETLIPGKLFIDVIKSLSDAAVRVQQRENEVHVTCETSSVSIRTMDPADFDPFPHVDIERSIEIPFPQFAQMVHRVGHSASRDESRAIMTGIYITAEEGKLRMVATDSYRLALAQADIDDKGSFEAIIPNKFLQDIAKLPKSEDMVKIALAENQIVVTCGRTVFMNRCIEGNYPNYKQLIPDSYTTRAEIDVAAFSASVKRASLFASLNSPIKVDINNMSQTILIDSISIDVGSVQETLPCRIEGEDIQIGFNSTYIHDGLNSLNSEKAYFDIQSSLQPGIFRLIDDDSFMYLIMPILDKRS